MSKTEATATLAPLALDDIDIPGRTVVLPDGSWGINIAAAQENFPHHGLQIRVLPWTSMSRGDSVAILLDNTQVGQQRITDPAEVGRQVTMFVAKERLLEGSHVIHYRVTRVNGSPENSPSQKLFVKLTRPGGTDQDGDLPGHSELKFTVPEEIKQNGVGPEEAKAGVTITVLAYPHMTVDDDIRFSWGGQFVNHQVKAGEAGKDIPIAIDEDTIVAGGDSDDLALAYEVYDRVQNRSSDWSKETRIQVSLETQRLDAPMISETKDDGGQPFLDLNELNDAPLTGQVVVDPRSGIVVGDKVQMKLRGTALDGRAVSVDYPAATVTKARGILEIELPIAGVRRLAKTQAVFSYIVIKSDSSVDMLSKNLFLSVVGDENRLAAPSVKEAVGNTIDPDLPQVSVIVPWDENMSAGNEIQLYWLGTKADGSTYLPDTFDYTISNRDADQKQALPINVDSAHLMPLSGGKLELYYLLLSDKRTLELVTRESLHSQQFTVGQPRARLPAPVVEEEKNGALDPALRQATVTIAPYEDMAVDDKVHLVWTGSETDTFTDFIPIRSSTVGKPVSFTVTNEHIGPNDGGTVIVFFYVIRASGITDNSVQLTLTVGEGTEEPLPPAVIEALEGGELVLDDVPSQGLPVTVPAWPDMAAGDHVVLSWQGKGNGSDERTVTGSQVGKDVTLNIARAVVAASVEGAVTVTYTVDVD